MHLSFAIPSLYYDILVNFAKVKYKSPLSKKQKK